MVLELRVPTIKGLRVRLSRLRFVSVAVVPLVFLAACSSAKTEVKANPLDVVTVGGNAKAPSLALKTKPLSVKATTTKVVTAGTGAKLAKTNAITFNYVLVNGKDGKQIESSFGKQAAGMDLSSASLLPGLSKGLTGQKLGSRLLVAIPPADAFGAQGNAQAGFGPKDTVLFLIDLVAASTPLTSAKGAAVPPKAGLPTATVVGGKPAVILVPKTAAPTKLVVQPLIKGTGPAVESGQTVTFQYTGVLWDGTPFDSSWENGAPFTTMIGTGRADHRQPGAARGPTGPWVRRHRQGCDPPRLHAGLRRGHPRRELSTAV